MFQGCYAGLHLGYERIASRLRLAAVAYITGRVLVGVQYHPHSAVVIAFVGNGVPRYALPDGIHRDAHDFGGLVDRHPATGRASLSHEVDTRPSGLGTKAFRAKPKLD